MEADSLPIDIHYSKLLSWLISRRHCNKDWQKSTMEIRKKLSHAIQDMPEDKRIIELLECSYINFFHCIRVLEILEETEKDTKSFFGFYSSQKMNDWLEIRRLYERNNIGLAEGAQIFQRTVQYEIPAIKQQISKLEQNIIECTTKEENYSKQMIESRRLYEKELLKMNIKGIHFRRELLDLAKGLPDFLTEIASKIRSLHEPLEYYKNFRNYLNESRTIDNTALLPLCSFIMERTDCVTVYEWKYGKKPESIEIYLLDSISGDLEQNENELHMEDKIDFGDEVGFDLSENLTQDNINIEIVGDEKGLISDGVARGLEALNLLENPETQKQIINELKELEKFLMFRVLDETSETASDIFIGGLEMRNLALKKVNVSTHECWLNDVKTILNALLDPQKIHVFKVRTSPQYLESIIRELEQKKSLEGRYMRSKEIVVNRRIELLESKTRTENKLARIIGSMKLLKSQVEAEISNKYKGRVVNIVGGLNLVT